MITRTVTHSESGKRLHRYLLTLLPNYPLGQIYKMIEQGKVKVNGKRKKQNYELAAGDELSIFMVEEAYKLASTGGKKVKFAGVNASIAVIYEDAEMLVVNKPVGLLTHPDQAEQKDTLITRVHAYLYKKGELDSQLFLPATANRLDRNTSGLVLIGKTAGMLHQLNQWIQKREMEKYYVTLVEGIVTGEDVISAALVREAAKNRTHVVTAPSGTNRTHAVNAKGGSNQTHAVNAKSGSNQTHAVNAQSGSNLAAEGTAGSGSPARGAAGQEMAAETRYRTLLCGNGYTLVEVELISGRTHQIRTHFQSIGHPLLGDVKYGGKPYAGVNHQLLHAWRIELPDGRSFTAPLPALFAEVLKQTGITFTLPLPQNSHK